MVKVCPKCNFENSDEAKFCARCGLVIINVPIVTKEEKAPIETETVPVVTKEEKIPIETVEKIEPKESKEVKKIDKVKILIIIIAIEITVIGYLLLKILS